MTVVMFPGQGAQRKGMGRDLFECYPEIDEQAGEILGYSIVKLCTENPNRLLDETQYTQPAMFVVNALSYRHALDRGDGVPDAVLGHSLGEYNALHAAGVIDFPTALRLVQRRGEAMGRALGGAMAAITGLGREEVEKVLVAHDLTGDVEVANDNAPDQVVISGGSEEVGSARLIFEAHPCSPRVTPLRTSGAFHSARMSSARAQFARYLAESDVEVRSPSIPVVANVLASPYPDRDRDRVLGILVEQVTGTVRWRESMQYLFERGERTFVEVGVGRVLTGLLDRFGDVRGPEPAVSGAV